MTPKQQRTAIVGATVVAAVGGLIGGVGQFGSFWFSPRERPPITAAPPDETAPLLSVEPVARTAPPTGASPAEDTDGADTQTPPATPELSTPDTTPTAAEATPTNAFTEQPTGADVPAGNTAPPPPRQPKTIDLPSQPTGQ
jgi:hypothetical protein